MYKSHLRTLNFVQMTSHSFSVAGGKTTFIKNIVEHSNERFSSSPGTFYYFYKVNQPLFGEIEKLNADVRFIAGMPESTWIEDNIQVGDNATLIFDDIASHLSKGTKEIFTVLSHHLSCNVILTVHNLFEKHHVFRDISLNSKYLVLFKESFNCITFILAQQVSGEKNLPRLFSSMTK